MSVSSSPKPSRAAKPNSIIVKNKIMIAKPFAESMAKSMEKSMIGFFSAWSRICYRGGSIIAGTWKQPARQYQRWNTRRTSHLSEAICVCHMCLLGSLDFQKTTNDCSGNVTDQMVHSSPSWSYMRYMRYSRHIKLKFSLFQHSPLTSQATTNQPSFIFWKQIDHTSEINWFIAFFPPN